MQAARALRVNVTVGEQQLQQHLLPPQISCDQEMVFFMETVLAMLLLVGLVWLLNRDRDGPTPDSFAQLTQLMNQFELEDYSRSWRMNRSAHFFFQQGVRGVLPPQLLHLAAVGARPAQNAEHEEPGGLAPAQHHPPACF